MSSPEQGDLKEAELSKQQVVDCQRDMLKHMGDLSLVAAGMFVFKIFSNTPPPTVVDAAYRSPL